MAKYEIVRDLGAGQYGLVKLVREIATAQLFAVKFMERGNKITEAVEREVVNHQRLRHPNIIRFIEVFLTSRYLGIVMEYAPGGELYHTILSTGGLHEDLARLVFQQLIAGVNYLHSVGVCHRDLKLENILFDSPLCDGNRAPRVKICDFGTSKSRLQSDPNTLVGTPVYFAPEIINLKRGDTYDGKMVDVWTCGVTLYVMLVGAYPFGDSSETPENICNARYSFPSDIPLSRESRHLISRIFVVDPEKRITISEIRNHPWYLYNLPEEIAAVGEDVGSSWNNDPLRSSEEVLELVRDAKRLSGTHWVAGIPIEGSTSYREYGETSGYEGDEEVAEDEDLYMGESDDEDLYMGESDDEDLSRGEFSEEVAENEDLYMGESDDEDLSRGESEDFFVRIGESDDEDPSRGGSEDVNLSRGKSLDDDLLSGESEEF